MTGQDDARKLGELAEIHLPSDCADPTHAWNAPAVWAENSESETEGWFCLDGSGLWWFDSAAFVHPLRLVPQDAIVLPPVPAVTSWRTLTANGGRLLREAADLTYPASPMAAEVLRAVVDAIPDDSFGPSVPMSAWTVVPCSQCQRPRSTDPESEEGMSGMCLRCLHGGQPVADPSTLSDPELSEGERAAFLGSGLPRDGLAGSDEAVEALARQRQGPTVSGELAVIQQTLLEVKGWSQGRGRPAALLAAILTALDAVDRLARTDLGEVGRLTAEVARLRRERNQALQRELEAVCRCAELTADVAHYRAAIEQLKDDAQTVVPDQKREWLALWLAQRLAAALGDGE